MKRFCLALILLSCITAAIWINCIFVNRGIESTKAEIAQIPIPCASAKDLSRQAELCALAQAKWKKKLRFLSLSIHHNDSMQVSEYLAALCGAANANDSKAYVQTLSILNDSLEHVQELNTPTFWSIF